MNLFERLLHRRLCNEQTTEGGQADTASTGATETTQGAGETQQQTQEQTQTQDNATGTDSNKGSETQKTDEELAADKDKAEKAEKEQKQEGAPEKYEFKPAEGQELDAAALEQFEPIARELNLTNEQAQKMVDLYGTKIMPMVQQQQVEAWQKTTEQWAADVKADKEIGGDKLTGNLSAAQRALAQFGTPELKEYLEGTGLGNHPELVKAFVKIGKAMSEDGMVTGKESGQRSAAEVLYGK
ncbi:peptidase [Salmonella enterica]|uniref:Peptidase n=1 Tax=Salmonella enterica TaxID=28901 RepID=A0A745XFT7_SALER|nr:peptidase [Salmonella enterica]EAM7841781.1 peptidase [Salmonella enterica subsp. enterica]EBL3750695.1 peptidase [Salmonella enterica subsp. enterica serovar Typhimurium]EBM0683221.1 peptidase [Salmonella enterica subsp. enterica serovar Enteritidis]EBT6020257.1 peptidase [Salmonella enterica subsp. enterica serovar Thomasville]EBY8741825.1 peptidase [Salmonella enterica subsp. enterica serovar Binza]EDW5592405.1 peptidase [Salmonella enterica subsp. enterica serovar Anatum]